MEQYALLFDSDRCVYCKRCITACREENNITGDWDRIGVTLRESNHTEYSHIEPFVQICNQCENPGCIEACPVEGKAIYKRAKDGIVLVDPEKCTGCGRCVKGCPYDAIHLSKWKNSRGQFIADKCTLCVHQIDKLDEIPEDHETPCVSICPVGALTFGKREDLEKKISWKGREADRIDITKNDIMPSNIYLKKRKITRQISL